MNFYKNKITDSNEWLALRSISYFDDADQQPTPRLFQDIIWSDVKVSIAEAVKRHGDY